MSEHLNSREYYEDLYDKHTVERCRRFAAHKPTIGDEVSDSDLKGIEKTPKNIATLKEIKANWGGLVTDLMTWCYAADRYNQKDTTISDWMRRDRERDEQIAKVEPPDHVRCRECLSTSLRLISKDEYWHDDKRHQMLFMYKCTKCDTNTAFFETGEQYHPEPTRCPKCRHDKQTFTRNESNHKLTITYTCASCAHVWFEELDFTPTKPEEPDPNYIEDRKLYCYSDKVREWADSARRVGPILKEFDEHHAKQQILDEWKEELEKVERLTIAQASDKLKKSLSRAGYSDFQLGQPDMGKQVVVPFNVIDGKARSEDESRFNLYKLISKLHDSTNWRLVRTSLTYRMGYLTGKLKGYESDEDLRILLEKKAKK